MGQRIPHTSQMIDSEINQHRQGYYRQEAPILVGAPASYPLPNVPSFVTSSASTVHLDSHYLPEHYDGSMSYGSNTHNGVHQQYNLDLNFAAPGSFYYLYATPSSSNGVLGVPLNHTISDQLTSSSNHGVNPVGSHYLDESRSSSKKKIAQGYPVNFPYSNNGSAGSSSSLPHPIMVHDHNNHRIGETTRWQHLQLAGEGCVSSWNLPSTQPYIHGSNSNCTSLETLNSGVHGYRETSFHQPPTNNWPPHNYYHRSGSTPSTQGMRGHNIIIHSQMPPSSHRFPLNHSRSELGPVPPSGFRLYRPHRADLVPRTTLRHQNLPRLRVFPADEVALLEIPEFYEAGNFVDHHRDLRLDIEHMSYEELLALGERIGSVNTGLSMEIITNQLKTKSYASSATLITPEGSPSVDKEVYSCIICQENYQNKEKIGILNCGHEYHADCLKKWLLIKNVCPICKSEALGEQKE